MNTDMNTEWTSEERREALINNGLDWYLVDTNTGTELRHATSLSNLLQCGEAMEEHGITAMERCWNGEDLGE